MSRSTANHSYPTEPGLALYLYYGCPYCERVRRAAARLGILLEERNILENPDYARELVAVRRRRTVPVLRIEAEDGTVQWLPESRDIVRYLEDRFGDREADASGVATAPDSIGWLRRLGKR